MPHIRKRRIRAYGIILVCMVVLMCLSHLCASYLKEKCSAYHLKRHDSYIFNRLCLDPEAKFPHIKKPYLVIFDAVDYSGSLQFLDDPPDGWAVTVINGNIIKQNKTCHRCTFVPNSWAEQYLAMDDQSSGLAMPMKVKMAAYLYIWASEGHEWIYVTNQPRDVPYRAMSRVMDREVDTSLVFNGPGDVFEPCQHFVDPFTWYGRNHSIGPQSQYVLRSVRSSSIYYVVDECFHSKVSDQEWKISFDLKAPIPFVMAGTFGIVDFNNVLVSHDALWALIANVPVMPPTKLNAVPSALKVNLAVQRALWETKTQIAFIPSEPWRKACSVCNISSSMEALGKEFREGISNWRCDPTMSVFLCLNKLIARFVQDNEVSSATEVWLRVLDILGVEQPERLILTPEKLQEKSLGRPLIYTPAKVLRQESGKKDAFPANVFAEICKKDGKPYKAVIPSISRRNDVLLIITFNEAKYVNNIRYLDFLYRRFFSHIVYCASDMALFVQNYQNKYPNTPVNFITMSHVFNIQTCATTAMQINFDVIGYFQISDDVLINLWNYHTVPMRKPWFQSFVGVGNVTDARLSPGNRFPSHFTTWDLAREPMKLAWEHLQVISKSTTPGLNVGRVKKFLDTLADNKKCKSCVYFGNADIFYIPQRLAKDFAFFTDIFYKYNVHFEVAVITVIKGIAPNQSIHQLSGPYVWGEKRKLYKDIFEINGKFYHPWKFSELKKPDGAKFFCERFLHNLDKDLSLW